MRSRPRRSVRRRSPRVGKMLVPLDGSQPAERVLPYVERLAAATNATVVLLEAVPTAASLASIGAIDFVATAKRARAEARNYLAATAEKLASQGVQTMYAVAAGPPVEQILRAADQEKTELIAMTTHGLGGLKRLVVGSVADEVMRRTSLPVFLLPVGA